MSTRYYLSKVDMIFCVYCQCLFWQYLFDHEVNMLTADHDPKITDSTIKAINLCPESSLPDKKLEDISPKSCQNRAAKSTPIEARNIKFETASIPGNSDSSSSVPLFSQFRRQTFFVSSILLNLRSKSISASIQANYILCASLVV